MAKAERELPDDVRYTPRESFLRWQEFAFQQLGTASSVMLILAFGILGTKADWPDSSQSASEPTAQMVLEYLMVGAAGISIFCGGALHNNRFSAFHINLAITRRTWSAERVRSGGEALRSDLGKTADQLEAENEKARCQFDRYESRSFAAFKVQAWALVIAMAALALDWSFDILA